MHAQPTVFLDRDGTILTEVSYLSDASRTELLPGVAQALATLQKNGIQLIVVSNQSGIARGLLDEGDLVDIQNEIDALLQPYGVRIDGYYHCPHHPEVGVAPERRRCQCRKPHGGMLDIAAQDFDIDWQCSVGGHAFCPCWYRKRSRNAPEASRDGERARPLLCSSCRGYPMDNTPLHTSIIANLLALKVVVRSC
jgi:D,D-heptose 1,7-bisphosphate phosphatase